MELLKDLRDRYVTYGFKVFVLYLYLEAQYRFLNCFLKNSYSQMGEDLIIDKFLRYKKKGFYVDVGAGDPTRFSNTKRFYGRGWTGINIEPNPYSYKKLALSRQRDINLNIGIGKILSNLVFYFFLPETLSTFSLKDKERVQSQGYRCINEIKTPVFKLSETLEKYCRQKIDFLSIDVEGFEFEVLKSNDWQKFYPELICVETAKHTSPLIQDQHRVSREEKMATEKYLADFGYKKCFDNGINSIFIGKIKTRPKKFNKKN